MARTALALAFRPAATDQKEACARAAHEVIAEHGVEQLSLRDQPRRLGVSHLAPYKLRARREHLPDEAIRRCLLHFAEAPDARERHDDARAELYESGCRYRAQAGQHALEYRLMFATTLACGCHPAKASRRRPGVIPARPQPVAPADNAGDPMHDVPAIIDIEASGFGARSYPIEIGYVLGNGRTRCTLVKPPSHWTHWDDSAERVHGILRPTLLQHGREITEVADLLNGDLAGQTVYCDGWAHDYPWLALLFDEAGRAPRFRLESVARLLDEPRLARLDDVRRAAVAELGLVRHRASNDARALQLALSRI